MHHYFSLWAFVNYDWNWSCILIGTFFISFAAWLGGKG